MRASRGLKWENKMYKLKRSIVGRVFIWAVDELSLSARLGPLWGIPTVPAVNLFHWWKSGVFNILVNLC